MKTQKANCSTFQSTIQQQDEFIDSPLQKPKQDPETPPDITLTQAENFVGHFTNKLVSDKEQTHRLRIKSQDLEFSIIGFLSRKLIQKRRERLMSADLLN